MTGEMYQIDPITGEEPDGTIWEYHAAIAKAVGGTIEPFDQYQGPYVLVGEDVRVGVAPYQHTPTGLGVIRLWILSDDLTRVYREDTNERSEPCFEPEDAARAALALMGR